MKRIQLNTGATLPRYRALLFPGENFTRDDYHALEHGEVVEVGDGVAHFLVSRNRAQEVENDH